MINTAISPKRFHVASVIDGHRPRFSESGLNRIKDKYAIPRPLTRTVPELEELKISTCVALDLAGSDIAKRLIPLTFTYKEYMEYALYDGQFGYYTTRPGIGSDFYTTPMKNSPHYGACLADLVFRQWCGMVAAGSFSLHERFDVVELGAGTGVLARDFVQYVKTKSGMDPIWKIFHANLRYMTGEISPELQTKQKETTALLKDKVTVVPADARDLVAAFGENGVQGLVISNELPDAFSCHKIMKSTDGNIYVAVAVPVIKEFDHSINFFLQMQKDKKLKQGFRKLIPKIHRMNTLLRGCLQERHGFIPSETTSYVLQKQDGFLTKELYKKLRSLDFDFFDIRMSWKEFWVPVKQVPEVEKMQEIHRDFFTMIPANRPFPFNTDLRPFQKGCGRILNKGMQIHIDYMYDNADLIQWTDGFRTYPSTELHDYSRQPGEEDITSDVSASALAVEGVRANFIPFQFCSERELLSQLPNRYPHLTIRKEGLPFYVLTMLKKGTLTSYQSEILTRPVTYRELFVKFSDWSCAAVPSMRYAKEKTALAAREVLALLKEAEKDKIPLEEVLLRPPQILLKVESKNTILQTAVHCLALKMVGSKPSFLEVARNYKSVEEFDYKNIIHYFTLPTVSDKVDKVMIQLVHQVLQQFYNS